MSDQSNGSDMARPPEDVLRARRRAELLVDAQTVTRAIDRVAVRVTLALKDADPLVLCVMNGGLVYSGRLLARLHFPLEAGFIHLGRYGNDTRGGSLNWLAKSRRSVVGRQLLVVDDVLDEGVTLRAIGDWASGAGMERLWTTVLVRKRVATNEAVKVDFVGLECPDRYLFGCGMDYRGYWRNLPAIYALPPEPDRIH